MRKEDLEQVVAIEEMSFPSPWSRKSFKSELKKEYCQSIVSEIDNRVVAYLILWIVADEVHIANVAVHPVWRKRGIGEILVRRAMADCEGFYWIGLEVRRSNMVARSLYIKLGFCEVGVHKNYYAREGEDALLMAKWL